MAHTNAEEERRDVKHTGELLCAPCVGEASRNAHASRHRGRCARWGDTCLAKSRPTQRWWWMHETYQRPGASPRPWEAA